MGGEFDRDYQDLSKIDVDSHRITRAYFYDVNRQLITAHEDGSVRRWDVETGKHLQTNHIHEKIINDLKFSVDSSHFITASADKTAKLIDSESFQIIKDFNTERRLNSADISPLLEHVLVAGGQDTAEVTNTAARAGKFESLFFHKVYAIKYGSVRGHFGPVNAVAFSPGGRSFCTGGEDGYVRLQHFDDDYFTNSSTTCDHLYMNKRIWY